MIERPPPHLLSGGEWHRDPFPAYAELRRDWPVARVDWPQRGAGEWLLTRYEDVHRVLADSSFSVRGENARPGPTPARHLSPLEAAKREALGGTMFLVDPPRHAPLRVPVSSGFTPQKIRKLLPKVERRVDELLEAPLRRGHFDLIREFAAPLPAMAITEMLGVPHEDLERLHGWSNTFVSRGPIFGTGPVGREVTAAVDAIKRYLGELIEERRREPRDDLISHMVAESTGRYPMNEYELVTTAMLLLAAGFETTKSLIGNGIDALLEHPGSYEKLAFEPAAMPTAVEEFVRYDSPIQFVGRIATRDLEVAGVPIPRGAVVRLALGSANRDPEQFERPDVLDIGRQPNRHLGFAHGIHFCLGSHLARMIAAVAFTGLLERFATLSLAPNGKKRGPNPTLRGYARMQLICTPRS